ncbi:hypothetical protein AWH62_00370 [Maricaulis sp. W15]|uniref:hypothetical protein n=1 Tax=Maricaulis sp. W15 TaxID=1772333 RepID=UPI00094890A3|nr:hypothetical protein [Maricaulis sp. W15]OLF81166.1 hypothetical protein AWH62_00370 [Maricaulis sp. W15]
MILSRIARALKDQNWLAVGIEFVIVILGVVIGFQVTAWNADRAEQDVITRQLHEVRDDIRADITAIELTRDASLWRLAAAEYLLTEANDGAGLRSMSTAPGGTVDATLLPTVTEADLPMLLARVNLIRGVTGRRTGYQSLVNGGSLRLIEAGELRSSIQRYYAGYDDFQRNLNTFRDIRSAALPVLFEHGFSLFSDHEIDTVLDAARNNPAFLAYLRTSRETGQFQTASILAREDEARALLALINAELDE